MIEGSQSYWLDRWQSDEIGFHLPQHHPWLEKFLPELQLSSGDNVLLPLCGKSQDMIFLREQDFKVSGIELSEKAIAAFFEENNLRCIEKKVASWGAAWHGENIVLYQADLFSVPKEVLTDCAAVYDRAAFIALDIGERKKYVEKLYHPLKEKLNALLITLDYDEGLFTGPPFSLDPGKVEREFADLVTKPRLLKRKNIIDDELRFKEKGLVELWSSCYHLATD